MDLESIDDHEKLLVSESEAVSIADMAQHLLKQGATCNMTELHVWPESAVTLAIVISAGLEVLNEDGRINK